MESIKTFWSYRDFILGSVRREFQATYKNSLFGAGWAVARPLAMIVVYTVVFSQIMRSKLPGVDSEFAYSIYLCAGVLTWTFFNEAVTRGQNVFIENANLLKKIHFPRLCLPIIALANAFVNFLIIFSLFTLFMLVTGAFPGKVFVALIPVLAIQVLLSAGLGLTLGVLNVFFRDVGQLSAIVLQFWFWATPIVYPLNILPPVFQQLLSYNPMTQLMGAYQQILVKGQWPDWYSLWPITLIAVLLCLLGVRLFDKHAAEMADEL
ncbi:MAG: ABC transporter permease [Alcaligenaceae bacterium]